jgi:hypothetical protein
MLQFASDAIPVGSVTQIRGLRALGEEAPLRAAIENGERLLVCASVRFADRTSSQPLWLTDRRFIFTRSRGRMRKLLVSVPIASSALDYLNAAPYPLHLTWTGADGKPSTEAFRAYSWKDAMRSEGSAGAAGGVTGGVVGAIVGVAVDAAIKGAVGDRGVASRDQRLYSTIVAAQRAPGQVRPVDLTLDSGSRLLIGGFMGLITAVVIALGVFALVSYQAKQAYEAAPLCGSVPSPDCRLRQPAAVTAYRGASGQDAYCDLFLSKADGSTVEADLHTFNLCAQNLRGKQVSLEYWRRSLTAVIPPGAPAQVIPTEETADNPEYNWRFGAVMAGLCGVIWVIFAGLSVGELIGWVKRRSLLRASAYSAGYLF